MTFPHGSGRSPLRSIVVVGASLAGLNAAETLRRGGFDGKLTLVGAEPRAPYDRPPLSKEILRGDWEPERTALRKGELDDLGLVLRLGRPAAQLDLARRAVVLDGGETLAFDALVIATGASPRTLPAAQGLAGIHLLRTLDDALALRAELARGPRVVVVGAGFIGAEVASACRHRGLHVTVIETLPVPLEPVLGKSMGELCAALHLDHGVDLRCGVAVEAFEGSGRVERVRLADGSRVAADLVVVGIGVRPETRWLEGSGLALRDGVVCDATCATSVPGIVAAGDVACWHNPLFDEEMRVEHWTNAVEQGAHAAETLLAGAGAARPFASVPLFWSDQYGHKLQFAGRARPDDEVRIVHGSAKERRFVALYGRAGRLSAAFALGRPRQLMACRRLLREGASFEQALAAVGQGR